MGGKRALAYTNESQAIRYPPMLILAGGEGGSALPPIYFIITYQ